MPVLAHETGTTRHAHRAVRLAFALAAAAWAYNSTALPASAAGETPKPFQKYFQVACAGTHCQAKIASVKKKQRLKVTNISCEVPITMTGIANRVAAVRQLAGGGEQLVELVPVTLAIDGNVRWNAVHAETLFYVGPGEKLQIAADLSSPGGPFACHVAGEMTSGK